MFSNLSDRFLLLAGAVLCAIASWYTIGYHHPDEHFQIWEFANYKLGHIPASALPWEFPARIRPGLQPYLAYCAVLLARSLGLYNPFIQIFLTRLLCGAAALFVYMQWCKRLESEFQNSAASRWLRLGVLFFWLMPYLNVRFTSENTAALSFFGGLLLLLQALDSPKRVDLKLMLAGLLLGLSFFFRYQIAFAGMGLFAWLIFQKHLAWTTWINLLLGASIAIAMGLVTDIWLYGDWVFAPYNYFFSNIVEGKAAEFGVEPFWWYLSAVPMALVPPLSFVLVGLFAMGLWRKPWHPLSWCVVPFILAHSLVGHKEVRFMFPMALPFFFLAAAGWQYVQTRYPLKNWMVKLGVFCLILNIILLVFKIFSPAETRVAYAKFLWEWAEKHPDSRVYFVSETPEKRFPIHMSFYMHPAQEQDAWYTDPQYPNDTTAIKPGDLMFFTEIISPTPVAPLGFKLQRAYSFYPDWMLRNNTNNWQSRTRIWGVYQLEKR